jgi:hypothetical protein
VRAWVWIAACGALAALGGCAVGSGSGSATGSLFVVDCNYGASLGTTNGTTLLPGPYTLAPTFFAGTPIEDQIRGPQQMNVIEIRMQTSGLEFSDALEFDVQSSYEVARCVRGRTVNGQPDYLVYAPLPAVLGTAANPSPTTLWCDWSGMAFSDGGVADAAIPGTPDAGMPLDGGMSTTAPAPRIHLTPYTAQEASVIGSISLQTTCPGSVAAGVAMDGWIQFENFGGAEEADKTPELRDPVSPGFVINYGDRLRATFDAIIGDPRYVTALQMGMAPPTSPAIGGELAGYFDFDLARGRAAQPFP